MTVLNKKNISPRTYSRHYDGTGKLLIVTTCSLSGDFASVYMLDSNSVLLGHISETTEFLEDESKPKQTRRAARFFQADDGVVVCKVDIHVDDSDGSSLSNEVFLSNHDVLISPSINKYTSNEAFFCLLVGSNSKFITQILGLSFDNVVVLTSNHIAAFKTSNPENAAPLTRCLRSAQWTEGMPAKQLDRPNVIGGLPGAGKLPTSNQSHPSIMNHFMSRKKIPRTVTEMRFNLCTWLGDIFSCSCLTVLPDPA